jgi:hypothetical protein
MVHISRVLFYVSKHVYIVQALNKVNGIYLL